MLARGEAREQLIEMFGADAYGELQRLARAVSDLSLRGKPRVYVLPGLMGSRIGVRGTRVDDVLWLDLRETAAGRLMRLALPRGRRLAPLGVMLLSNLKLKLKLQLTGFDARFHPYDWRLPVAELARQLNERIARERGRDVMIVGHSLGGLVARAALESDRGRIARLVQLGAPNAGSFAPVLALRAVYPTVRKIAALDPRHSAEDLARQVFATLPSLHEMLPPGELCDGLDLFDRDSWPDDTLRPELSQLARARAARAGLPPADVRCLQIVGVQQPTVTGLRRRAHGFEYRVTADGDGTVPLALARWSGARSWVIAEKHGALPNNAQAISAVAELLRTGDTRRLPGTRRRLRAAAARIVTESDLRRIAPHKVDWRTLSAEARRRILEPVASPEFHDGPPHVAVQARRTARSRTVVLRLQHGTIADANAQALLLGLFRDVDPSGAANDIDRRLDGAIREFSRRRLFDGELGRVTPVPVDRAAMAADRVLFVGMGDVARFDLDALRQAARSAVQALTAERVHDFATVVFGAGSGLDAVGALAAQLRGIADGLVEFDESRVIRRITFCEIDARRHARLRGALAKLSEPVVTGKRTPSIRFDFEDVGAEARRAERRPRRERAAGDPAYLLVNAIGAEPQSLTLRASLLTAGAKAAVLSGVRTTPRRELEARLARIEGRRITPRGFVEHGESLARLLLPPEVVAGLESSALRPLVVVHDRECARVPWEALAIDGRFPALTRGLSRRYAGDGLSAARWRENRALGEPLAALVAADPTRDLPGAAREARALQALLRAPKATARWLIGDAATRSALLDSLRSGTLDVLHFAGHAWFDPDAPGDSGLLCADEEVLRGGDLADIAALPALVFFNACEAARVRRRSRGRRAIGVAEAFLDGGVANFLGTHWPVDDGAALTFSTSLYAGLLDGATLGEAVLEARRAVERSGSSDWANYIHYGNPGFGIHV